MGDVVFPEDVIRDVLVGPEVSPTDAALFKGDGGVLDRGMVFHDPVDLLGRPEEILFGQGSWTTLELDSLLVSVKLATGNEGKGGTGPTSPLIPDWPVRWAHRYSIPLKRMGPPRTRMLLSDRPVGGVQWDNTEYKDRPGRSKRSQR